MARQPVVRVGDPGSHGGVMITGASTVKVDGKAPCRIGDIYDCPIPAHGPNPLVGGSSVTKIEGAFVSRINEDRTSCGDVITSGSPTWSSE